MTIDRTLFFNRIRVSLFSGRLSPPQVVGIEAILDAWEAQHADEDRRFLAYMLATAFHETAATFRPVRETLADSDAAAIVILDNAFRKGRLSSVREPYWRRDPEGKSWLGRGLVQLTHKDNYLRLGKAIGIDLVADPTRAMQMDVAVRILFTGMIEGLFTGKALRMVFNAKSDDWVHARQIINGLDRADLVAGYGRTFHAAISSRTK